MADPTPVLTNVTSPSGTVNQFNPTTGLYSTGSEITSTTPAPTPTPVTTPVNPAVPTSDTQVKPPVTTPTPVTPPTPVNTTFGVNKGTAPTGETKTVTDNMNNVYTVDSNGQIVSGTDTGGQYLVGHNISEYPDAYKKVTGLDINGTPEEQQTKLSSDMQAAAKTFSDTVTNIQNGTIPLSAAEQSQVDALTASYQDLINKQVLTNTAASGLANIRGYQSGAAEYDPSFQTGIINNIVSAGATKLADLQDKESSAVASLTQALKDNDIAATKTAYDALNNAQKESATELQNTINNTQAALKTATDAQNTAIANATSAIVNDSTLSVADKEKAITQASNHLTVAQMATFTATINKQKKDEDTAAAKKAKDDAAAKAKAIKDYQTAHANEIMGNDLADASAALKAGADPVAVRQRFIQQYPKNAAQYDAYFKKVNAKTTIYPGTSTSTPVTGGVTTARTI